MRCSLAKQSIHASPRGRHSRSLAAHAPALQLMAILNRLSQPPNFPTMLSPLFRPSKLLPRRPPLGRLSCGHPSYPIHLHHAFVVPRVSTQIVSCPKVHGARALLGAPARGSILLPSRPFPKPSVSVCLRHCLRLAVTPSVPAFVPARNPSRELLYYYQYYYPARHQQLFAIYTKLRVPCLYASDP